jgi:hypothetical protein
MDKLWDAVSNKEIYVEYFTRWYVAVRY